MMNDIDPKTHSNDLDDPFHFINYEDLSRIILKVITTAKVKNRERCADKKDKPETIPPLSLPLPHVYDLKNTNTKPVTIMLKY